MSKEIVKFIRKSNDLVEARYKFDIWETRLFTKMLTMIRRDDEDFKEYKIYMRDVVNDFDLKKNKEAYKFLRSGARKLMKKSFYIPYEVAGVKRLFETPVVSSLDSAVEDGRKLKDEHLYITISFHPKIKPYLLQLKSQFTVYDVRNILKLPSTYSIRIYELLKQYEKIGQRTFDVLELKEMLGIEDKYKLYGHFKERVIAKAQKDLAQYTDISFTYEELKWGRAVKKIKFYIAAQNPAENNLLEQSPPPNDFPLEHQDIYNNVYSKIKKWISEVTFKKWLKSFPEEQIKTGVRYTLNRLEKGDHIPNIGGYLNKMVQQTRLFDPIENNKQKVSQEKQKAKTAQNRKAELVALEKELRKELYDKELRIINSLFNTDPVLQEDMFLAARSGRASGYDSSMTVSENYELKSSFRSAVHNKVKQLYPEKFKAVQSKYESRIRKVKREIGLL